jgi:ATP-dependent DNA helicase DinG
MLTLTEQDTIRAALKGVTANLPNYKPRKGQKTIIAAIAHTLAETEAGTAHESGMPSPALVCEAGTGTGKSLAYLMPSIALAKSRKKHVIIATSTTALQDQLIAKELPLLQQHSGLDFSYAPLKGRQRFVCKAKLRTLVSRLPEITQDQDFELQDGEESVLGRLVDGLRNDAWPGERDALGFSVPDALWNRIRSDRHGCSGKRCPDYEGCAFYRARLAAEGADVVVTNHDLLLASTQVEPGKILPNLADSYVIVDEAHSLGTKATQQFSNQHCLTTVQKSLAPMSRLVAKMCHVFGLTMRAKEFNARTDALDHAIRGLVEWLQSDPSYANQPVARFPHGALPADLGEAGQRILDLASWILQRLIDLREEALTANYQGKDTLQRYIGDLGDHIGRLEGVVATWQLMLRKPDPSQPPIAKWIACTNGRYSVCAAPSNAGKQMTESLWTQAAGAVFLSATIKACGSFAMFLDETGLTVGEVQAISIESPFNYREHGELIVPMITADPSTPAEHTAEVIELMPGLVNSLGTLIVCCSTMQMQQIHDGLPLSLQQKILMQGSLPKSELLTTHRERIARGESSILLGLQSFGEGVDLPGEECSHVIIPKLPFPHMNDPVAAAEREWAEMSGQSSFDTTVLPEASRNLRQWVGRLLRSESDHGRDTILDKRLLTKRYGQKLLACLPPFRRTLGKPAFSSG